MIQDPGPAVASPLSPAELERLDAYWRAANYLSVGQIYLLDNPLLREPLRPEHVKPRLLGHWGTTPGINLIYAHMNRVIRSWDLDAIYVIGPGHGGPATVANAWLEGTYTELYPSITRDAEGMRRPPHVPRGPGDRPGVGFSGIERPPGGLKMVAGGGPTRRCASLDFRWLGRLTRAEWWGFPVLSDRDRRRSLWS